jgi:hypothetical protein
MAAPRKYTDEQRAALCRLINDDGLSVPAAVERLAAGIDGLAPLTISCDYARQLAREDRAARGIAKLEEQPLGDAIDTLARRTLIVVSGEIARLQAQDGPLDGDQILKLARTIKELHPLAKNAASGDEPEDARPPQPPWVSALDGIEDQPQAPPNAHGRTTPLRIA